MARLNFLASHQLSPFFYHRSIINPGHSDPTLIGNFYFCFLAFHCLRLILNSWMLSVVTLYKKISFSVSRISATVVVTVLNLFFMKVPLIYFINLTALSQSENLDTPSMRLNFFLTVVVRMIALIWGFHIWLSKISPPKNRNFSFVGMQALWDN